MQYAGLEEVFDTSPQYLGTRVSIVFASCADRYKVLITATHISAVPVALCFVPCSISTVQSGKRASACMADCLASSMLFTMINERVAFGLSTGESMRDRRDINTVVFPDPVGSEMPMRDAPPLRAAVQASRQDSWYGRKTTGKVLGLAVETKR